MKRLFYSLALVLTVLGFSACERHSWEDVPQKDENGDVLINENGEEILKEKGTSRLFKSDH